MRDCNQPGFGGSGQSGAGHAARMVGHILVLDGRSPVSTVLGGVKPWKEPQVRVYHRNNASIVPASKSDLSSLRGAKATKQSSFLIRGRQSWIASRSLSSGRALRRPVGSQ